MPGQNIDTVAVAMSGGVDSSVAAYLLKQKGFNVFGITMVHMDSQSVFEQFLTDAKYVCRQLGIAHHVIHNENLFQNTIIENFLCEYAAGRTPNPCVMCNREIKWGRLREKAHQLGAGFFATGHYARVKQENDTGRVLLLKAKNRLKDQSYALWRLTQEDLNSTLFPLGELEKQDTRKLAVKAHLHIADKKDSQEICFIPDDDYRRYLKSQNVAYQSGPIVTTDNKVVGEHKGIPFYTIGQRKGLGIALGRPVYVIEIDKENNRIVVGDKSDLYSSGLVADQTNWMVSSESLSGTSVQARIRYNDPGYPAIFEKIERDSVDIRFLQPRPAVTPGQSAVFYRDDRVIGGGIIRNAVK